MNTQLYSKTSHNTPRWLVVAQLANLCYNKIMWQSSHRDRRPNMWTNEDRRRPVAAALARPAVWAALAVWVVMLLLAIKWGGN